MFNCLASTSRWLRIAAGCSIALTIGCGGDEEEAVPVDVPSEPNGPGLLFPDAIEELPTDDMSTTPTTASGMPVGFTATDRGGWRLGDAIAGDATEVPGAGEDSRPNGCGSVLTGIVRDIQESHPDFGGDITDLQRGLVQAELGADGKPALSNNPRRGFIQNAGSFSQWYASVPGVNLPFALSIYLAPNGDKFSFESHDFFPLDGEGFGNQNQNHNFSFTFELHTRFRYDGGEVFQFSGDDDLWVFINGQLAIDLGGVHEAADQQIALDAAAGRLGIEPGNEYTLDFFQAERHSTESNFQIDTTLEFTNCGTTLR